MAPQKSHQLTMQTLTHLRSIFVVEDSSGANEQDFVAVRPSQAPPKIGDPGRIDQVWLRGEGSIERRKRQPDSLPLLIDSHSVGRLSEANDKPITARVAFEMPPAEVEVLLQEGEYLLHLCWIFKAIPIRALDSVSVRFSQPRGGHWLTEDFVQDRSVLQNEARADVPHLDRRVGIEPSEQGCGPFGIVDGLVDPE